MSLRARLLAMFVAIILLVAVTMGIYNFRLLEVFFRQAAAVQLTRVGNTAQAFLAQLEPALPTDTPVAQQAALIISVTAQSRVLVTDAQGLIVADTGNPSGSPGGTSGSLVGQVVPNNLIKGTLRQGQIQTFDYPGAGAKALAVSVPWMTFGQITGSVLVVRDVHTEARQTALEVSQYVFRSALLASAVALVAAYFLSSSISDPLRKMSKAAVSISKGNFSEKVDVKTQDELGDLAQAMNSMSGEISALIDSLTQEKEKLQGMIEERTQMISDISHDLRTPVTSIRGFVEALRDGVIKDEAEKSHTLNIIHEESERLSRLVDNLFYLARLEAEESPFEMTDVDVADVTRRTVETVLPLASEKEVNVTLEVDEEAAGRGAFVAAASDDRLTRAILNVLDNAVKYSPHGGNIKVGVKTDPEGGRVVVSVSDEGPGIPQEDLARIFERFYRTDKARSSANSGAGLGLSIARFIVEQHKGSLWAESTVGKGSTFYIAVPAS